MLRTHWLDGADHVFGLRRPDRRLRGCSLPQPRPSMGWRTCPASSGEWIQHGLQLGQAPWADLGCYGTIVDPPSVCHVACTLQAR